MKLTLENLKSLNVGFRKEKNTLGSNLTSTLIGEIQNELKSKTNSSEEELVNSTLLKVRKSLLLVPSEEAQEELKLIDTWLPKLMTEEEIKVYILERFFPEEINSDNPGRFTGIVVGKLKGKAEGSLISKVIKNLQT